MKNPGLGVGEMNALGREGWELVAADGRGCLFFKRGRPGSHHVRVPNKKLKAEGD